MLEGWPKVAANGIPLSDSISAYIHDLHQPGSPSPAPGRASAFCLLFTLSLSPLQAHLTSSRVSKHLSSLIISMPSSLLQRRYLSVTILPLPALKPYILYTLPCAYFKLCFYLSSTVADLVSCILFPQSVANTLWKRIADIFLWKVEWFFGVELNFPVSPNYPSFNTERPMSQETAPSPGKLGWLVTPSDNTGKKSVLDCGNIE